MAKKFIVFIDTQVDFMLTHGALPVAGAVDIIGGLNDFAYGLDPTEVAGVLFTFDTHHEETYSSMPESQQFPIHCVNGSAGWQNVINHRLIKSSIPKYKLTKGVFNMWEEPGRTLIDLGTPNHSHDRDRFFEDLKDSIDTVVIVGVAADFCVKWAIDGFITLGYNVEVPQHLTAGIFRDIQTVVSEDYAGQAVTITG